jgi:DNA-binding response OmpR family regulator
MNAVAQTPLALNPRTLQIGGPAGWIDISDAEYRLLEALAKAWQQRLDISSILEHVGKPDDASSKRALEVQLVRLRKKLVDAGAVAPTIKAIRGFGYQLCIPLAVSPAPTFAASDGLSAFSS